MNSQPTDSGGNNRNNPASSSSENGNGNFTEPQLPKRARTARMSSTPSGSFSMSANQSRINSLSAVLPISESGDGTPTSPPSEDEIRGIMNAGRDLALSIYGPDAEIPPCVCRVPQEVKVTDEIPEECQGQDTINGAAVQCLELITTSTPAMVRCHVRDRFKVLCDAHMLRLRLHQCCPGCGIFCLKGQFNKCRDSEFPHYFHLNCANELGQCPHCLTLNYGPVEIDLSNVTTMTDVAVDRSARMSTPNVLGDGVLRHLNMHTLAFARRHTHRLPDLDKEICTADLGDAADRESIRKAISSINRALVPSPAVLEQAMTNGNLKLLLSALNKKMDPNFRLSSGLTLLQHAANQLPIAASQNYFQICYVLISLGANVNMEAAESGQTALMIASNKGHYGICNMLIKFGKANIELKDNTNDTALHYAAKAGAADVVSLLLYCGKRISVNEQDNGGWTPLMWAIDGGILECVDELLTGNAKLGITDNEGNIALHWAAINGSVEIGRRLLRNITNVQVEKKYVNKQNEMGLTPLMIACREKKIAFMEFILARGADPLIKDKEDKTAEAYLRVHITGDENDDPRMLVLKLATTLKTMNPSGVVPLRGLIKGDLSNGKERVKINVVNDIDDEDVENLIYVTRVYESNRHTTVLWHINPDAYACLCKGDCGEDDADPNCLCASNYGKIWYDGEGRLREDFPYYTAQQPQYIFECNPFCRCLTSCRNRVVQRGLTVSLKLVRTADKGWGVFANEDIPKGKFICEYAGELIADHEAEKRLDDTYLFELCDANLQNNPNLPDVDRARWNCIDANKYGNVSRYFNHGCESNLILLKVFYDHMDWKAPHIAFFACKDIRKNEEITFDYGPKFWAVKGETVACKCRSAKCLYGPEKIKTFLREYALKQAQAARQGGAGSN